MAHNNTPPVQQDTQQCTGSKIVHTTVCRQYNRGHAQALQQGTHNNALAVQQGIQQFAGSTVGDTTVCMRYYKAAHTYTVVALARRHLAATLYLYCRCRFDPFEDTTGIWEAGLVQNAPSAAVETPCCYATAVGAGFSRWQDCGAHHL
jgi:hypothetical protein